MSNYLLTDLSRLRKSKMSYEERKELFFKQFSNPSCTYTQRLRIAYEESESLMDDIEVLKKQLKQKDAKIKELEAKLNERRN